MELPTKKVAGLNVSESADEKQIEKANVDSSSKDAAGSIIHRSIFHFH